MTTRDAILAANDAGTLLESIAATPFEEAESVANVLASLHNSGEIDFLAACHSKQLDAISDYSFLDLQRVFCDALPRVCCSAASAAEACKEIFDKTSNDYTAGLVYDALRKWFQQSAQRAEEGLSLIRQNAVLHTRIVRPVLLGGATHDPNKFADEALKLSNHPRSHIRSDAIWALGRLAPEHVDQLLQRVIDRLGKAIEAPISDGDSAAAIEAALHLLHESDGNTADDVERLLIKACEDSTPATRQALAIGLQTRRSRYTDEMIDATLEAIQYTSKREHHTIQAIDNMLYRWDLDGDRQRVLGLLAELLSHADDAIELSDLRDFRYRLGNGPGKVLGWYVVSLLLTGSRRLCIAADQLLPYQETRDNLDVDLMPFALSPSWILFLARKIIGFCLFKKESAAALLLSCLRVVPDQERPELEELVMNHFLLNYVSAIEWFESAVSPNDSAKDSVDRLSISLKLYIAELSRLGICPAFRPNERENHLQMYRQIEFERDVRKKSEEGSIFSIVGRNVALLYGTAAIVYVDKNDGLGLRRQEISMSIIEHKAEFPRLHSIDPVGLNYYKHCFQSEPPPR